jgi:hypothetical protein
MWTCPKCKIEVEPAFDVCWSCGTSRDGDEDPDFDPEVEGIMGADEFEAEWAARTEEKLVTVATFRLPQEAHALQARLEAEGIRATAVGEHAAGINFLIADVMGGVRVLVLEHDADRARAIVEDELESRGAQPFDEEE